MTRSLHADARTPDEVVALINSGDKVFIHGAAATPTLLLDALAKRTDLEGVELYHLHLNGELKVLEPEHEGRFFSKSLFVGPGQRKAVAEGRADFIPVFLSDMPHLFRARRIDLDVAILQLSPPDKHGDCTLGPSIDTALTAAQEARTVIAEINAQMPRTTGNSAFPFASVDAWCLSDHPLHTIPATKENEVEARIGELIADLVEDGSTLQLGIGAIPDAALSRMKNKHELGIHTEMFSDRVVDLMEGGVVTNEHKAVHQGRTVTSFVMGSQRLYDFVDDNLKVEFYPCDRTNDTHLIRKNPGVVAINSAIEIDLSGQVCADSIGHRIYSGIGGQMDFIRGAALSVGGLPIIALPSTAAKGQVSRITPQIKAGGGVVTTRGHVEWVVTEYGAVDLHGLSLRQRGEALISIAHPDFRAELTEHLKEVRHFTMG